MLNYILLTFILLTALAALEIKNNFISLVLLAAMGTGVWGIFLIAGSLKLAIFHLIIEILLLWILARATVGKTGILNYSRNRFFVFLMTFLFALALLFSLTAITKNFVFPVPFEAATIIEYSLFDVLGMLGIIFAAALASLVILRGEAGSSNHG